MCRVREGVCADLPLGAGFQLPELLLLHLQASRIVSKMPRVARERGVIKHTKASLAIWYEIVVTRSHTQASSRLINNQHIHSCRFCRYRAHRGHTSHLRCPCSQKLLFDLDVAHFLLQLLFLLQPRPPLRFNLLLQAQLLATRTASLTCACVCMHACMHACVCVCVCVCVMHVFMQERVHNTDIQLKTYLLWRGSALAGCLILVMHASIAQSRGWSTECRGVCTFCPTHLRLAYV